MKPRVLVVEDEQTNSEPLAEHLGREGFDADVAGTIEEATRSWRATPPDLILLDVMLPGIDGWHVAEELAASPETREIPILFLSARSDRADEERGHEAGALGYITKPFDPEGLIDRIRDVLERATRGEREALRREWRERLQGA